MLYRLHIDRVIAKKKENVLWEDSWSCNQTSEEYETAKDFKIQQGGVNYDELPTQTRLQIGLLRRKQLLLLWVYGLHLNFKRGTEEYITL